MKKQDIMEQELILRTESTERALSDKIDRLSIDIPAPSVPTNAASIVNLLDNSDWNWSHLAYTTPGTLPATAGDPNHRAYNWFRSLRSDALLVEDDAHSLKGPTHSLFGAETADTPRWDRTNGWPELGETGGTPWDLWCPLPNNFVTPGMRFRLQMLVRLRTVTVIPGTLKLFWLLQDNTAASPDTIKGSAFALNGNTFGTAGATTRSYKLIVDTDYGGQVESTVRTITNTPAVLVPGNGVALTWERIPGFTNVTIYVTEGGASFIAGIIGNGSNAFNDVGQRLGAVGSVPTVTTTQAKAYAETAIFTPTLDWQLWRFSIIAPQTYNFSLTTGKQCLRGGVIGFMGDPHQLQIDRIGLSTGDGLWAQSARDTTVVSPPSTSQTSSTQGPPSGGGGSTPGDGEGRLACSTLDTPIDICEEDGEHRRKIDLGEVTEEAVAHGLWLVGKYDQPIRVKRVKIGWSELILTIKTNNGAGRRCSPSDLWLQPHGPESGTAARRLCEGMEVLTRKDGQMRADEISEYSASTHGEEVCILETHGKTDDERVYWAGDAGAHNAKSLDQF